MNNSVSHTLIVGAKTQKNCLISDLLLIREFLQDKEINYNLFGTKLLREFRNLLASVVRGDLYMRNPYQINIDKSLFEELIPLYNLALGFQEGFLNYLLNKNSYWKEEIKWEEMLPIDIEQKKPDEQIRYYDRAVALLRVTKEPFLHFEIK